MSYDPALMTSSIRNESAAASTVMFQQLMNRIESHTATVGVIGLGYVGLPLALLFSENRYPVIGFDVDTKKVDALTRGASYIKHIGVDRVSRAFTEQGATATADFSRLGECDALIIAVPTPLGEHREP